MASVIPITLPPDADLVPCQYFALSVPQASAQ
jgi:hypothetical protein